MESTLRQTQHMQLMIQPLLLGVVIFACGSSAIAVGEKGAVVSTPQSSTAKAKSPVAKAPAPNAPKAPQPNSFTPSRLEGTSRAELLSDEPSILFALMASEISVDFDETTAKEAINYIGDVLGIQMMVRWQSEKNPTGMNPETPITMKFAHINALDALEQVLEELSSESACTWQLRKGFLEVGTKENLARPSARRTVIYPIKDLLYEVPYFDNAPNFNIDAALNQGSGGGGGAGGGGGGGGGFGGGGMGGGGGGSGGSGGGGGGGGSLFGNGGPSPERTTDGELARNLIELIKTTVEPDAWAADWAFIEYNKGCLIVRAPDFVHRELGGYPFMPTPHNPYQGGLGDRPTGRYVSMTAPMSFAHLRGFTPATVGGSAGGTGFGGGNP